jgi:hypothetical protein
MLMMPFSLVNQCSKNKQNIKTILIFQVHVKLGDFDQTHSKLH